MIDDTPITRRRLLKVGSASVVAASLPGLVSTVPAVGASSWWSRDTYRRRLGQLFTMRMPNGRRVDLRLDRVTGSAKSFDLVFTPLTGAQHPQGIYRFTHRGLGSTDLFVVPCKAPRTALKYVVSINRAA